MVNSDVEHPELDPVQLTEKMAFVRKAMEEADLAEHEMWTMLMCHTAGMIKYFVAKNGGITDKYVQLFKIGLEDILRDAENNSTSVPN